MSAVMYYVLLIGLTYRIVEIQYPLRKEYNQTTLLPYRSGYLRIDKKDEKLPINSYCNSLIISTTQMSSQQVVQQLK